MRPVVAPFPGVLGFKTQTFWIWGDNGYKCLGTHLNDDTPGTNNNRADMDFMLAPNLRPGDTVRAGQLIGYVGDSGVASGSHLHFELFAAGNELFSPFPSLKAAEHITAPRPVLSDPTIRPPAGQARIDGCVRGWDPTHRVLTLLLVARQTASGRAFAYTTPTRCRLTLPPDVVATAGGDETLRAFPRDRAVTLFVAEPPPGKGKSGVSGPANAGGTAFRLVLPIIPPTAEGERVKP